MKNEDELERIKKQILPETINLHSMICTTYSYQSTPSQREGADGTMVVESELQESTFELVDPVLGMKVTISFTKHNWKF